MAKKPGKRTKVKKSTTRKPAARKKGVQRTPRMTRGEREARQQLGDEKVDEIQSFVRQITSADAILEQVRARFPDVAANLNQPTVGIMLPR
jgi:hypothetical protein